MDKKSPTKGTILFVCVKNSCRSQMAEAILNKIAEDRGLNIRAISAGTNPADKVNQLAVQVLREIGIEISGQKPKLLTQEVLEKAEKVITMGCVEKEACPVVFRSDTEDWGLEDPSGKPIEVFREIRDIIKGRVERLLSNYI